MYTVDSPNLASSTIPVRICQTCGIAKSLDHFVSMYTEASTSNCDVCRQKQREVYRQKQLKKRQFSLLKAKTMRLRSTENLIKTPPMDDIESVHSISASSPITSAASTDDTEVSRFDNMCQSITFTCIPHSRWLVCVINDAGDVPLARLVKKPVI